VRAVTSECLATLLAQYPEAALPALRALLAAGSAGGPLARAVAAHACRCALFEAPAAAAAALAGGAWSQLLACLADSDHRARQAACATVCAAAHYAPQLLAGGELEGALPALLACAKPVADLVRVVDLGPFKITVDDGVELRKAALECLDSLLGGAVAAHALQSTALAELLAAGTLDSDWDCKAGSHALLRKLAPLAPDAVLQVLPAALSGLEKTLTAKMKGDAVKQELERNEELVRSALRTIALLLRRLQGAAEDASMQLLLAKTLTVGALAPLWAKAQAEAGEAAGEGAATSSVDSMET
jgi:cullin-associated NEDD8-dissociated protein 1